MFYNSYHHQAGFQSISAPDDRSDDNESTSSWEDIQQRADVFDDGFDTDSTSDEEEEVVLPKRHQRVTQNEKQHKQKEQVVVAQTQLAPQQLEPQDDEGLERIAPRHTAHPTIYQKLTKSNVDWCRYCGTTEGVNWRPGPWGKRTLCKYVYRLFRFFSQETYIILSTANTDVITRAMVSRASCPAWI